MKKQLSIFLCLVILLSLVSCSESPAVTQTGDQAEKEDLSSLSAQELYEKALSKTKALSYSYLESVITFGEESKTVKTTRIRTGYDSISFARLGEDNVWFNGKELSVSGSLGNFTAPATSRAAQEYLNTYYYPVSSLEKDQVSDVTRDGLTLFYTVSDQTLLELFSGAAGEADFQPERANGTVELKENGILEKETIVVSGKEGQGEVTLVTTLVHSRSDDASLPELPEGVEWIPVGDIRIPHLVSHAVKALENKDVFQATILSSHTLSVGEEKNQIHSEINCYQNEKGEYYLSRQTLTGKKDGEESRFYQILAQGGSVTENEYNVITGEKMSESISETKELPWSQVLKENLLPLSQMANLTLSQESGQNTVSFSVSETGCRVLAEKILALFPDSGATLEGITSSGTGVFTTTLSQGELTAFSFSFQGSSASSVLSAQYSVTVDETEQVTLPSLQIPTPTTPGMEGDHSDHQH